MNQLETGEDTGAIDIRVGEESLDNGDRDS
jgi:hypothetical protein